MNIDKEIDKKVKVMDFLCLTPTERVKMASMPDVLDEIESLISENKSLHKKLENTRKIKPKKYIMRTKETKSVARVCIETGKTTLYLSIIEASRENNISNSSLRWYLMRNNNHCGGYKWSITDLIKQCRACGLRDVAEDYFVKGGKTKGRQKYESICKSCYSAKGRRQRREKSMLKLQKS